MSEIIIKINGEKLEFFDNVVFSSQINSISSSFSFNTFYDIPLYEFAKIQVYRNNVLFFTGTVIEKIDPNNTSPEPFNYKCYSLTGILEDCTIPLESYPIQTKEKTLKEIVENLCNNFEITVKIDSSASSDISSEYEIKDQSPDSRVSDIINNLCSQQNLILTHNAKGELIITKKVLGNNETYPFIVKSQKRYNYRSFYYQYNVLGQQPANDDTEKEISTRFSNIDKKRTITVIQNEGDSSITQKQANAVRNDSYKSNSLNIEFNDFFANVGNIFIVDDVKCLCNSVNYNYNSKGETCAVSLLNSKVYQR